LNKKLFIICFTSILALSFCRTTDIKAALRDSDWNFKTTITKTESRLKYYAYPSKNGKEAWVYRISGNVDTKGTTLSIPKAIDGRKVTRIGDANLLADPNADERKNIISVTMEYWKKSSYSNQIKNVVIPDTVEVIEPCTFGGMPRVETIKIPKNVTKINEYTFYKCKRLKKVILPANLKELNPLAFYQCPNLKTLKLSPKNTAFKLKGKFLITRKDNALVYAAASGKALNIPNGIKTIKQNACNNVTAPVVHIPASVSTLEEDALTSLNIDEHNRIPTTDGRLLRRIVRDARTRGASAKRTINMWPSVRRGEEMYIFPFQEGADEMFNSVMIYELSVLKQYAEPILFGIDRDAPEYMEAKRLLKFLDYFVGVDSSFIPENSLIREFIGGGCFRV